MSGSYLLGLFLGSIPVWIFIVYSSEIQAFREKLAILYVCFRLECRYGSKRCHEYLDSLHKQADFWSGEISRLDLELENISATGTLEDLPILFRKNEEIQLARRRFEREVKEGLLNIERGYIPG